MTHKPTVCTPLEAAVRQALINERAANDELVRQMRQQHNAYLVRIEGWVRENFVGVAFTRIEWEFDCRAATFYGTWVVFGETLYPALRVELNPDPYATSNEEVYAMLTLLRATDSTLRDRDPDAPSRMVESLSDVAKFLLGELRERGVKAVSA